MIITLPPESYTYYSQNTLCKRLFIHIRELLAPPNTICVCKRANFNMYRVVVSAYLNIFENSWPNRILYVCLYFRWRCIGAKKSMQTFLYKVFREPFGSWTSAPKIVDVRTKKCVFLRPRWWGETFWPRGQGRPGVRVRNVHEKSRPKSLCLCRFFFPEINSARI